MQKFYLNTISLEWYDENGEPLPESRPSIPLGNSERIVIQCCSETPSAGTPGIVPETDWTKDTQFDLTGVTALLSADNNFLRHLKGTVATAIGSGEVSSAVLTISGATNGKVPKTGAIRLFSSDGESESLEYTARSISGTTVTFTLASGSTLENSYAQGATADCPESLYAQAAMDAEESNPANGLFVFDFVMDSLKLREASDYSDTSEIQDIKGLELLVFTVSGTTVEIKGSYLCRTLKVPIPMADPNQNPDMPETYTDSVAAMVNALLGAGFDLQFSADGTSWHDTQTSADRYFRIRNTSSGESGTWSTAIQLPEGATGQDGVTPHIDSSTKHWMLGETDTGIIAEGQNGAGTLTRLIVSGATTASAGNWYLCESDVTITLPAVTSGGVVKVSTIGSASSVTINPAGSDTIEGDSEYLLGDTNNAVELIGNSGGTMWIVAEVIPNWRGEDESPPAEPL